MGLLVSSTRLNRTNDRLSARFDLDVPDADIPWMIAANALSPPGASSALMPASPIAAIGSCFTARMIASNGPAADR
jgi:hypothetical protein